MRYQLRKNSALHVAIDAVASNVNAHLAAFAHIIGAATRAEPPQLVERCGTLLSIVLKSTNE